MLTDVPYKSQNTSKGQLCGEVSPLRLNCYVRLLVEGIHLSAVGFGITTLFISFSF